MGSIGCWQLAQALRFCQTCMQCTHAVQLTHDPTQWPTLLSCPSGALRVYSPSREPEDGPHRLAKVPRHTTSGRRRHHNSMLDRVFFHQCLCIAKFRIFRRRFWISLNDMSRGVILLLLLCSGGTAGAPAGACRTPETRAMPFCNWSLPVRIPCVAVLPCI